MSSINTPGNRQFLFMFTIIIGMQFLNKIDFQNQTNKMILFIIYGVSQSISLFAATLIYFQIKKKNDTGKLYIKNAIMLDKPQATTKDSEGNEIVTQTIMEYDMNKCKQMFVSIGVTVALITFLYYKFQIIKPLALQSLLAIKNLFDQPLVSIHIFGKPATGDLARPFKAPSIFSPKEEAVNKRALKRMEKKRK
ncbi:hypothetical protein H8356DRAFT_963030 [Neocallimastix lanati (nom. inval.)]|jgi:hypothetical protein|uniref:Inorganic phosphate transporter n=1 Tax=Neocallimastix californiae TaxID=1754190 RepID=A0A1Y2DDJ0_9FUNG|nr:hypothetical protein H8356DRAFT_963030 [Neocallimastix sp. JGI-2020a]ORY57352.1 hypothetical protein LY90DRAFT_669188 [Neocallimastix californiae]|eukprot:ORY57352.1 hypothetical protein LY90DRAFT_669188 [Neocallimastix californiae]